MSELKTLKDLTYLKKGKENVNTKSTGMYSINQFGELGEWCFPSQLKQEAIKIYRELEKLKKSHYFNKKDFFQNNFQENPVVVLRFLEWFFNITEEDLK